MKTQSQKSEFDTMSPGHKILFSAAAFAVLGSFVGFLMFGTTLTTMDSFITNFTNFVIGGMFSALVPVVFGNLFYSIRSKHN